MSHKNSVAVWCVKNEKEVFINDNEKEIVKYVEKKPKIIVGEYPESAIYLPLIVDNRVIGVMTIQSFEKNAYTSYHLDMMRTLASYAAIAMDNSNTYENLTSAKLEIEKSNDNIKLISEIGQQITSTLDLSKVLKLVYTNVNKLMDASAFLIGYYNEGDERIEVKLGIEKGKTIPDNISFDMNDESRLAVWCVKNKKEVFINDIESEYSNYIETIPLLAAGEFTHSLIYLPLLVENNVIGIITVQSFSKNAYTSYHLELLKTFASYAAVALNNAQSFAQLESAKAEIETSKENITLLSKIGQQITSSLDLNKVLKLVYDNVNKIMDASSFLIGFYNQEKNVIEMTIGMENNKPIPENISFDMNDKNRLAVWCVDNKKEIFIKENAENANYIDYIPPVLAGKLTESVMYLPLMVEKRVVGVITVQSFNKNAYSPYHLELLKTLASYAAVALNNAESYNKLGAAKEEIEKSKDNITLLSKIGQQITSTLDITEVLDIVYENINKMMDASGFFIGSYDDEKQIVEVNLAIENEKRSGYFNYDMTNKKSLVVWAVKNKKEVFINDFYNEYNDYIPNVEFPKTPYGEIGQSMIILPLVVEKEIIGVIIVQSYEKNAYSNYHLEIIRTFASYAAVALNNAESFAKLETAKSQIEIANQSIKTIAELGQKITSTFDLEEALQDIYTGINTLTDATTFGIWYYNENESILEGKLFIEKSERLPVANTPMSHKGSLAVWSILNKKDVVVNDYDSEFKKYFKARPKLIVGERPLSMIYIPLIVENRVIGVITIQSFEKNAYNNFHVEMMRTLGSYAAIAMDNAQAYLRLEDAKEEIEKSRDNITLLSQIGQQITSSLDLTQVLKLVYDNVNKLMDASAFLIGYYNSKDNVIEMKLGMENGKLIPDDIVFDMNDDSRLAVWCIKNQEVIFINDSEKEESNYIKSEGKPLSGDFTQSLIYIPLIVEGNVIGVVTVQSFEKNAYTEYHLGLLKTLSAYAAVALNNAEAYEQINKAHEDIKNAQTKLVESEKMASLGQLTAGIAHEINNPINFISGNVKPLERDIKDIFELVDMYDEIKSDQSNVEDILKNVKEFKEEIELDFVKEEIDQLLTGIKDGADRTAEIVKGLRTFSRLDEADKKYASINESLDNTLVILRNRYKGRIDIVKDYASFPDIECYPGKLNQVFVNIIGNAIQAIEDKGIIILKTTIDKKNVYISIKDDGMGMPDNVKEKIFDPFFTTKDVGEGTGLGLSISFGIIEKHEGTLNVNSAQGKGTEFVISLPLSN